MNEIETQPSKIETQTTKIETQTIQEGKLPLIVELKQKQNETKTST